MIKLLKYILVEDLEGALIFMSVGTFCLSFLLFAATANYLIIHEVVNQCHIQEES